MPVTSDNNIAINYIFCYNTGNNNDVLKKGIFYAGKRIQSI